MKSSLFLYMIYQGDKVFERGVLFATIYTMLLHQKDLIF